MGESKGPQLEELVRAYFSRQGFFSVRSVPLQFESEDVTDIDVWLYGRQAVSSRTRMIVDAKSKRSPKAFERILWARGMQAVLNCDRAIVATTDANPTITRFAQQQKVAVLTKTFLERLERRIDLDERLSLESFVENLRTNPSCKQDGDWLGRLSDAKAALASLPGFQAFNRIISSFAFFAERVETRVLHREQALRGTYLCAALACIALDGALERLAYERAEQRVQGIVDGVTFGDAGDGKAKGNIDRVLDVIAESMANGRVIAAQARSTFDDLFSGVRAEIIAEYFARENNAGHLFGAAKELDERAHAVRADELLKLSIEARSILGVFCDFVGVRRSIILTDNIKQAAAADPTSPTAKMSSETDGSATPSVSPDAGRQSSFL